MQSRSAFLRAVSCRSIWRYLLLLAVLAAWLAAAAPGFAQTETEPPLAEPVDVNLASDRIRIVATYYEGEKGKDTVPVILLHGLGGTRQDTAGLALYLQEEGHTVIAPDLRGHGDSKDVAGTTEKLEAEEMPAAQFGRMCGAGGDLETVKAYLVERHNAGELNIEKLCVVGSDLGALVAVNWTIQDWSWPVLTTGKQGQDVMGLVLISPLWNYKGLRLEPAMRLPYMRTVIGFHVCVGAQDGEYLADARRFSKGVSRYRPEPSEDDEIPETVVFRELDTELQGWDLVNEDSLELKDSIAQFIHDRLYKLPIVWRERKDPLK
jgi:pimeloyl-ACP methyl ester carboxylesterase